MNNSTVIGIMDLEKCERCGEGKVNAVVSSDIMLMHVCVNCALAAVDLLTAEGQLRVDPIVWM